MELENGLIDYSTSADSLGNFSFGTVGLYSCNTGFSLVGLTSRTCGEGMGTVGAFDGMAPFCEGVCLPTHTLSNSTLTHTCMQTHSRTQRSGALNCWAWPMGASHTTPQPTLMVSSCLVQLPRLPVSQVSWCVERLLEHVWVTAVPLWAHLMENHSSVFVSGCCN